MPARDVTTFCEALWRQDYETVARLAPRIDPNAADRWGRTALSMAAQYGDRALVERLVSRGERVDQDRTHLTPLTIAARRGAGDIVRCLLAEGAKGSIVTAIYLCDHARLARELQRDGTQARLRDEEDTPILHHAVEALQPEMVIRLLAQGASTADRDRNGETALHRLADRLAEAGPATEMARLLLDRGADANARNWDDVTPLHQAVRRRHLAVVEVLLARGADPNARDKSRGSTPLRRAVSATGASGTAGTAALMAPLTRILLEHGADPDARDKRGVPVHASARAPDVIAVLDEFRRAKVSRRR